MNNVPKQAKINETLLSLNSFGINRNDTPCSKVMYIAVFQKKDEKKLRSPDIVL
tara:strand:- start:3 stop:164 length:162 start_codon:yes stop_codon:yes gene_type:complete